MTTTLLSLEGLFSEQIGDWLEFDTSTNITTGSTARVIATTLQNVDGGADDYFLDFWTYITEGNNSGKLRKVKNYETSVGRLDLYGVALASESSAVTVRLHRFDRRNKVKALNRAIEQLYPSLHRRIDNLILVTGNILPDFKWWTSTALMKMYAKSGATGTLLRTTTGGLYRSEVPPSAKWTAGAASDTFEISSDTYPRLLDLMGKTVTFKCWAYPEVANDAFIRIYTLNAAGTAQTLSSTTACPAGAWTLLKLEDQTLSDDLVKVAVRFGVTTNGQYAYFDDPILTGRDITDYFLPYQFQKGTAYGYQTDGNLMEVRMQTSGYSDDIAYDLHPRDWSEPLSWRIIDDGTYRYLKLDDVLTSWYRLRLIGVQPLETLTADTDTISLDGARLNLIIAQAAYNLYQMERGSVSSQDKGRYETEMNFWANRVRQLKPTMMMMRPASRLYSR